MQSKEDLSFEMISMLLKRIFTLWNEHVEWIEIGGGEPLLHESLIKIISLIKENSKSKVLVVSNGSLFDEKYAINLKNAGLDRIQFSLDGATLKTHNWLRNNNSSYNQVIKATKICKKIGLPFVLRETLNNQNKEEIEDYFKLAKKLGASEIGIRGCLYSGNAKNNKKDLYVSPNEYAKILRELPKLSEKYDLTYFSGDPLALVANKRLLERIKEKYGSLDIYSGCCVGISYLYINNLGKISFCPMLNDVVIADPTKKDLEEIWENTPEYKIMRKREITGKCKNCEYLQLCGGCSAYGYWKYGKLFQENPICTFFVNKIQEVKI